MFFKGEKIIKLKDIAWKEEMHLLLSLDYA